jgi:4-hydroxy-4-methyl-2-oxoglutarate aldolase
MHFDPIIRDLSAVSTATAHEAAGKIGALPSSIKPLGSEMRLCGRAFPVHAPPGDNLFIHHAIYAANPGDVLVVECGEASEYGYWGEVMAVAAQARQIAGLVIAGGVRDSLRMMEMGFPVFAAATCIRGTGKNPLRSGSIGKPVRLGDVEIFPGDVVLGDNDGVLILPASLAAQVGIESRRRDNAEQEIFARLRQGETTLQIYNLPALARSSGQIDV